MRGILIEILFADPWMSGHCRPTIAFAIRNVNMRLTEISDESLMRVEIDLLVAEEHHTVRNDRVVDFPHLSVAERLRQIDIADFRSNMRSRERYSNIVAAHYIRHDFKLLVETPFVTVR
jgi:hypothetical protein